MKYKGNKMRLVKTCGACPEQYDVFEGDELVGYLRLRHGHFYASVPDVGGDVVYEAYTKGDGIFDDDERDEHLDKALAAIALALRRRSYNCHECGEYNDQTDSDLCSDCLHDIGA